jgi:cAMP-dependent protein kinase regulator
VRDIHDQMPAVKLLEEGEAAFHRGQWRTALCCFGGVVVASPRSLSARLRVADALLNEGRRDLAMRVYGSTATAAMHAGHPLLSLVAAKMLLLLDPEHEDVVAGLASLYARDSERLDVQVELAPSAVVGAAASQRLDDDDALVDRTAAIAAEIAAGTSGAHPLPPIPFLSHLDDDSFQAIFGLLRLRRFGDGEVILRQGERAESFFLLASGDVVVARDAEDDGGVVLARLGPGSVFGELALISDEPRRASVLAKGDVDALEIRCSDVIVSSATQAGVSHALKQFTRERFLRNLTATHPLFSTLSREERHRVTEHFEILQFRRGDMMIVEGQRGPGLFVFLNGRATVEKSVDRDLDAKDEFLLGRRPEQKRAKRAGAFGPRSASETSSEDSGESQPARAASQEGTPPPTKTRRVHLAHLQAGDLCGEMSMLSDQPTTATVTCTEDVEALFLGHDAFKAVVAAHPDLLRYLAGLSDERVRVNRALLFRHGLLEDDEHVML